MLLFSAYWIACDVNTEQVNKPAVVDQSASPGVSPPPMKKCKLLSQDIMNRNSAACSATTNSIDDELASYASATKSYPGSNALEFWVGAETTFPLLAPLAQDLISAPASEAYVERVFSVCGDLTSGKRSRLTRNLEIRTFLKINSKYYNWTLHIICCEHCGTFCFN